MAVLAPLAVEELATVATVAGPEIAAEGSIVMGEVADAVASSGLVEKANNLLSNIVVKGGDVIGQANEHLEHLGNFLDSLSQFHQNVKKTQNKFSTPQQASAIVKKNMKKLKAKSKKKSKGKIKKGKGIEQVLNDLYKGIDKKDANKRLIEFYKKILAVFHSIGRLKELKSITEENLKKSIDTISAKLTILIGEAEKAGGVNTVANNFIESFVKSFGVDFTSESLSPQEKMKIIAMYMSVLPAFSVAPTFGAWSNAINKYKLIETIADTLKNLADSEHVEKIKNVQSRVLMKSMLENTSKMLGDIGTSLYSGLQEGLDAKTRNTLASMLEIKPIENNPTGNKLDMKKGFINMLKDLKDVNTLASLVVYASGKINIPIKKLKDALINTNNNLSTLIASLDAKESKKVMEEENLFSILKDINNMIATDANLKKSLGDKLASGKAIETTVDGNPIIDEDFEPQTYVQLINPRIKAYKRALNNLLKIFSEAAPSLAKIGLTDSERTALTQIVEKRPTNADASELVLSQLLGLGDLTTSRDLAIRYKKWVELSQEYITSMINKAKGDKKKAILTDLGAKITAAIKVLFDTIDSSRTIMSEIQKSSTVAKTKTGSGFISGAGVMDTIGNFFSTVFGENITDETETWSGDTIEQSTLDTPLSEYENLPQEQREIVDDAFVEANLSKLTPDEAKTAISYGFGFGGAIKKQKRKATKKPSKKADPKKPAKKIGSTNSFASLNKKYSDEFEKLVNTGSRKVDLYNNETALTAINAVKQTYELVKGLETMAELDEKDKKKAKDISAAVFDSMIADFQAAHQAYAMRGAPPGAPYNFSADAGENAKIHAEFKKQKDEIVALLRNIMAIIQGIKNSNEAIKKSKIKIDVDSLDDLVGLARNIKGIVSTDQLDTSIKTFNNQIAKYFQIAGGLRNADDGFDIANNSYKSFDEFFNMTGPKANSIGLPTRPLTTDTYKKLQVNLKQIAASTAMFDDLIQKINSIYSIVGLDLFSTQFKFDMSGFINVVTGLIVNCSVLPMSTGGNVFVRQRLNGPLDHNITFVGANSATKCAEGEVNGCWVPLNIDVVSPDDVAAFGAYREALLNVIRIVTRAIMSASMQPLGILLKHLDSSFHSVQMFSQFASGGNIAEEQYSQVAQYDKVIDELFYTYAVACYFVKFYQMVLNKYNQDNQNPNKYDFIYKDRDVPLINILKIISEEIRDNAAAAGDIGFLEHDAGVVQEMDDAQITSVIIQVNKWAYKNKIEATTANMRDIASIFAQDLGVVARKHLRVVTAASLDRFRDYLTSEIDEPLLDLNIGFNLVDDVPTYDYSELPTLVNKTAAASEKKIVARFERNAFKGIANLIKEFTDMIPDIVTPNLDTKIDSAYAEFKSGSTQAKRRDKFAQFINGTLRVSLEKTEEPIPKSLDLIRVIVEQTVMCLRINDMSFFNMIDANMGLGSLAPAIEINLGTNNIAQREDNDAIANPPHTSIYRQMPNQTNFTNVRNAPDAGLFSRSKIKLTNIANMVGLLPKLMEKQSLISIMGNKFGGNSYLTPKLIPRFLRNVDDPNMSKVFVVKKIPGSTDSLELIGANHLFQPRFAVGANALAANELQQGFGAYLHSVKPRGRTFNDYLAAMASLTANKLAEFTFDKTKNLADNFNRIANTNTGQGITTINIESMRNFIKIDMSGLISMLESSKKMGDSLTDSITKDLTTAGIDLVRSPNLGLENINNILKNIKEVNSDVLQTFVSRFEHAISMFFAPSVGAIEGMFADIPMNKDEDARVAYFPFYRRYIAGTILQGEDLRLALENSAFSLISTCFEDIEVQSIKSLPENSYDWDNQAYIQRTENRSHGDLIEKAEDIIEKATNKRSLRGLTSRTLVDTGFSRGLFYKFNKAIISLIFAAIDTDEVFVLKPLIQKLSEIVSSASSKNYQDTSACIGGEYTEKAFVLPEYVFDTNVEELLRYCLELSSGNKKTGLNIVETFMGLSVDNRKRIQNQIVYTIEQLTLVKHMAMMMSDILEVRCVTQAMPEYVEFKPIVGSGVPLSAEEVIFGTRAAAAPRINRKNVNDVIEHLGLTNLTKIQGVNIIEWAKNYMAKYVIACNNMIESMTKLAREYLTGVNPIFENVLSDTQSLVRKEKDMPFSFITAAIPFGSGRDLQALFGQNVFSPITNGVGQFFSQIVKINSFATLNKSYAWIDSLMTRSGFKPSDAIDLIRRIFANQYMYAITAYSDRLPNSFFMPSRQAMRDYGDLTAVEASNVSYFQNMTTKKLSSKMLQDEIEISSAIDKFYHSQLGETNKNLAQPQMLEFLLRHNLIIINQSVMSTKTESPILDVFSAIFIQLCEFIETKFSVGNTQAGAFLKSVMTELISFDNSLGGLERGNRMDIKAAGTDLNDGERLDMLISGNLLSNMELYDDNLQRFLRIISNRVFSVSRQAGSYRNEGIIGDENAGRKRFRSIVKNLTVEDKEIDGNVYNFTSRKGTFMFSQMPFMTISFISMLNSIIPEIAVRLISLATREKYPQNKADEIVDIGSWIEDTDLIARTGVEPDAIAAAVVAPPVPGEYVAAIPGP